MGFAHHCLSQLPNLSHLNWLRTGRLRCIRYGSRDCQILDLDPKEPPPAASANSSALLRRTCWHRGAIDGHPVGAAQHAALARFNVDQARRAASFLRRVCFGSVADK